MHSLVAALPVVAALMMQYIVFQHSLPWGSRHSDLARIRRRFGVGITVTLRGQLGLRMLRFVTLVPVVLAVGSCTSPRRSRSGRNALRAPVGPGNQPRGQPISSGCNPAVCHVRRNTVCSSIAIKVSLAMKLETIPDGEHLLMAPEGWQKNIAKWTTRPKSHIHRKLRRAGCWTITGWRGVSS